ncbi:hypothetical protein [Streptomyces endophyticus]|uniref:Holin n=1 Tax=Streptomyces endophyticus TaxID=714166 RepID=A0ABU6F9B5_9ACTN|nr:hypothetical protein [Streptomyces endophyticus]MEB8340627.1 hypothetical protein [Streptomyces endophyticus]
MTQRLLQLLFRLSIVVFLAGGTVTVVGQALGMVMGDAAWVEGVAADSGPATCIAASISGMLSFVLSYGKQGAEQQDGANGSDAQAPRPAASATTH